MAAKEKKISRTLRPLVEDLQEGLGRNLVAVALFGSRARAEPRKRSDWDVFVLCHSLPLSPIKRYGYLRALCKREPTGEVFFLAKTQKEFEQGFPSFYLDLALDGIILFDTAGYMEERLNRIRRIINEAGLKREKIPGGFFWKWQHDPGPEWDINWKGFEVG